MNRPRILMLHRILPLYDAENYYFQRQTAISWLRYIAILDAIESNQYLTLPISQLNQSPPENAIFITFDDGYVDNAVAFDELLRRRMVATLFPVKDFIQQGFSPIDDMAYHFMNSSSMPQQMRLSFLNGKLKQLLKKIPEARYRYLREQWFNIKQDSPSVFMGEQSLFQYRQQGIELGIHGVTHLPFVNLTDAKLKDELLICVNWLNALGQSNPLICFPHGQYNKRVVDVVSDISQILLTVDKPSCHPWVFRREWVTEESGFPY